jgi:hypothetical protein
MQLFEFGPSGYDDGGSFFNERVRDDERVSALVVGSGSWIDSIQIIASNGAAERELTRHGGTGGSLQRLSLAPGERIIEISGQIGFGIAVNFFIRRLVIRTSAGQVLTAGLSGSNSFVYQIPSTITLCGLTGRSGTYLDYLGVICRD